jgi:hypothetical protein
MEANTIIKTVIGILHRAGLLSDAPDAALKMVKAEMGVSSVEDRKEAFRVLVMATPRFPDDIKAEFFEYWTELSQRSVKMRFEKEKSWELEKRMTRFWMNKVTNFGRNPDRWANGGPADPKALEEKTKTDILSVNARRPWKEQI